MTDSHAHRLSDPHESFDAFEPSILQEDDARKASPPIRRIEPDLAERLRALEALSAA